MGQFRLERSKVVPPPSADGCILNTDQLPILPIVLPRQPFSIDAGFNPFYTS